MNGEVRSATGRCTSRLSGQSVQLQLCYVTWKYIWLPLLLEQDGNTKTSTSSLVNTCLLICSYRNPSLVE